MKKVARSGRGLYLASFIFLPSLPLIPSRELPAYEDLQCIAMKAETRAGIGRILRTYHRAMEVCRHAPNMTENDVPKYGYRWLALHNATVQIFTVDKAGHAYCRHYDFCYKQAGFLTETKKYIAMLKFGYQQLF